MFPNLKIENSIFVAGLISLFPLSVSAQIAPDGTTNTTITTDGDRITINNGDRAGDNLFHSFRDFSVPNGGSAFFNNNPDIANIFSRVTGGNISNIDGLIRANGSANLFLINPAGIIFGAGARLDIGGSFYGSTADSILFEDGEFSATDLDNPPLLTINAPIGLNLRDNPAPIAVNGSSNSNLAVAPGENLVLVGGELNLSDSARIFAPGANVELGAVSGSGTVELDENLRLNFPDNIALADVFLNGDVAVNVSLNSDSGGSITINAANVELLNNSLLVAGILQDAGSADSQAGDIVINATEAVSLDGSSIISNVAGTGNAGNIMINALNSISLEDSKIQSQVLEERIGNAGNIEFTTSNLSLIDNSQLIANSKGQGNAGNINITVTDTAFFEKTVIQSQLLEDALGNAGNITINAGSLSFNDNSVISANTLGTGNAGNIIIEAEESVSIDNSRIFSQAKEEAIGNAGSISIDAKTLDINNNSEIESKTFGEGNAGSIKINTSDAVLIDKSILQVLPDTSARGNGGNIEINTGILSLKNASSLLANTKTQGDAGSVIIRADNISLDNSSIQAKVNEGGEGNAGNIEITTANLSLENDSVILSDTQGRGNAGNTVINASNSVSLDDSTIVGGVGLGDITTPAQGDGGDISITAGSVLLQNESRILANLENGQGNAGNVIINADNVSLDNSNIQAKIAEGSEGSAGNVEITTADLFLQNDSLILSDTQGRGNAGNTVINASNSVSLDDSTIVGGVGLGDITTPAQGDGGDISITAGSVLLQNESRILANLEKGKGNAGNVIINADDDVSLNNSDIQAKIAEGSQGSAGNIEIITTNLSLTNGGRIIASTSGQGNGGSIKVDASEMISIDGEDENGLNTAIVNRVDKTAIGNAGNIDIITNNLSLTNGGRIDASTFGRGDAGAIIINASENISLDGESQQRILPSGIFNRVQAEGIGNAGSIEINTSNLLVTNGGRINATTFGLGNAGTIKINALETISLDGKNQRTELSSGIVNRVQTTGIGNAGDIEITTTNLSLTNGGLIDTSAFGEGNGGNIFIRANSINLDSGVIIAVNRPSESITSTNSDRFGGNITLELSDKLTLRNNSLISAEAGNNANGGNISIDADFIIAFPSQFDGNDILASAEQGVGGNINITTKGIFGIEERPQNPFTNDIDASSDFGLDGTITINNPDVNALQTDTELPKNLVESEQTVAQACQSESISGKPSGLTIKGKGGIPPEPTEPFIADPILVNGKTATPDSQTYYPDIKPIKTSIGDIYPARGIIKTEDGQIILTAYPTDGIDTRTPHIKANCSGT